MHRLLVVDDEPNLAALVADALERRGYTCDIAHSVSRAFEWLETSTYSVVVSDLHLKDGDGLQLLQHVRSTAPDVGVIIVSAQDHEASAAKVIAAGAYGYLVKPVAGAQLAISVELALKRREAEHRARLQEELEDLVERRTSALLQTIDGLQQSAHEHADREELAHLLGTVCEFGAEATRVTPAAYRATRTSSPERSTCIPNVAPACGSPRRCATSATSRCRRASPGSRASSTRATCRPCSSTPSAATGCAWKLGAHADGGRHRVESSRARGRQRIPARRHGGGYLARGPRRRRGRRVRLDDPVARVPRRVVGGRGASLIREQAGILFDAEVVEALASQQAEAAKIRRGLSDLLEPAE